MLPRPFGFLLTAQTSVSGSASGNHVAWNKSLCSLSLGCLICKLGIIPPPHRVVLEMEPHQETQSSRVATTIVSSTRASQPGKAGAGWPAGSIRSLLPLLPAAPSWLPSCQAAGETPQAHSRLPRLSQRSFPWPSPLPLSHRVAALRGPVHLLGAGRRHLINQSINSKQMRTSCLGWNPGPSLRLPRNQTLSGDSEFDRAGPGSTRG